MNKIVIDSQQIDQMDIIPLLPIVPQEDLPNFNMESGKEHYRLLAYLSTLFNNSLLADIGTRYGSSALALSFNESNTVHSYDIITRDFLKDRKSNIQFFKQNIFDTPELAKQYSLIMLDIDPHNGKLEKLLIEYLRDNDYQGIMVLDDIAPLWPQLHQMWNGLEGVDKYDITHLGHFSGTGLINFNMDLTII